MGLAIGRGGSRRPVYLFRTLGGALVLVAMTIVVTAPRAAAHGGVPTVQLAAERVNPGGTLDLFGDMTTEGPAEILLIAPAEASVWSLGTVQADYEGHFRAFLVVPVDIPTGEYRVRAQMATETATTAVIIAGLAVGGEEGQLPGRDEVFAGAASAGNASAIPVATSGAEPASESPRPAADVLGTALIVIAVVSLAFVLGAVIRSRATKVRAAHR